jgi:hypothetical protein
MIAEALLGVGRVPESLERAERAAAIARDRGLLWSLPRALQTLARVRIAAGEPGAPELLGEAEEVAMDNRQVVDVERIRAIRETAAAG